MLVFPSRVGEDYSQFNAVWKGPEGSFYFIISSLSVIGLDFAKCLLTWLNIQSSKGSYRHGQFSLTQMDYTSPYLNCFVLLLFFFHLCGHISHSIKWPNNFSFSTHFHDTGHSFLYAINVYLCVPIFKCKVVLMVNR